MAKSFKAILLILLLTLTLSGSARALGMVSGTITKINPSQRMIKIKLKNGSEKTVVFVPFAQGYKMNQPALFYQFKPGEYVTMKICSPLNEEVWKAEVILDAQSAPNYTYYTSMKPTQTKFVGGGFATCSGAAPLYLPPITGVYPNATVAAWPNDNKVPTSITSAQGGGTGGTMQASPSPWGSPAIGDVLSQPNSGNSTGQNSIMQPSGVSTTGNSWAPEVGVSTTMGNKVSFKGITRKFDSASNILYIQPVSDPNSVYSVVVSKNTVVQNAATGTNLNLSGIAQGSLLQVTGVETGGTKIIEASQILINIK